MHTPFTLHPSGVLLLFFFLLSGNPLEQCPGPKYSNAHARIGSILSGTILLTLSTPKLHCNFAQRNQWTRSQGAIGGYADGQRVSQKIIWISKRKKQHAIVSSHKSLLCNTQCVCKNMVTALPACIQAIRTDNAQLKALLFFCLAGNRWRPSEWNPFSKWKCMCMLHGPKWRMLAS